MDSRFFDIQVLSDIHLAEGIKLEEEGAADRILVLYKKAEARKRRH